MVLDMLSQNYTRKHYEVDIKALTDIQSLWWVPAIAEGENQSKDIAATAVTLILIYFLVF